MQIGIDCSCVAKAERTGVARYCVSLLSSLPAVIGADDRVTVLYRLSRWRAFRHFEAVDDPRFRRAVFQEGFLPRLPSGLDVVHGPDLRIPETRVPTVSTVHDLSALEHPEIAAESFRRRKHQALTDVSERAQVILCISDYTERILLARYPAATGRTRVVPLGLSERFGRQSPARVEEVRASLGIAGRYLLFVGQISLRKNLPPLFAAFEALAARPEYADLHLVLAGPMQTGGEELLEEARAGTASDRIVLPGFVDDDSLPPLYAGAEAFCFTGKSEGFGLPILEAMACGCPVVVARAGANVSTAGDAALIFDADDADDLAQALLRLLEDSALRQDLIGRGATHAEEFSWRKTARRTVAAYRDALLVSSGASV